MGKFVVLSKDIDIFASLECGQTFRFKKLNEDLYEVFSLDKYALITKKEDSFEIESEDIEYFYKYFALDEDYEKIVSQIRHNKIIDKMLDKDIPKLRILKQDPFEMIFSFIISANNNIPRIKGIIDKLCKSLGEKIGEGKYAFPTLEKLASQDENFYKSIGLGYRAPYMVNTAKRLSSDFDVNALYKLTTDEAKNELIKLSGVGPKVADCILLFGYNKYDVFPVDTWIKKVYLDIYKTPTSVENMRRQFLKDFGPYAGIAQQYLFYSKRER